MNKKDLKMYEAPASEVVELKMQGILCVSGGNGGAENIGGEGMGSEEE